MTRAELFIAFDRMSLKAKRMVLITSCWRCEIIAGVCYVTP